MVESNISDEDRDVLSQSELAFGGSYDRSGQVLDMLKDGRATPKPKSKNGSSKFKEPAPLSKAQKKKIKRQLKKNPLSQQLGEHMNGQKSTRRGLSQLDIDGNGTESGLGDSSVASVETGRDNLGKDRAPHLPRNLLYTRRVEGIVPPIEKPILEGELMISLLPPLHLPIMCRSWVAALICSCLVRSMRSDVDLNPS